MSLSRRLSIATIFAIVATPCCAWAGGHGWHNTVARKLGLGWSDGYHADEGCPTERVGSRKHPSRQGYGHSFFGPYSSSWMPERPHHGPHGRAIIDGDFYGHDYDERFDDPERPSPTPALRPSPVSPDAPDKSPMPGAANDKEARRPSEMFRLAPIR